MQKLFTAAIAITILAGPAAHAADMTTSNSVAVRYDDIDTRHEAGAKVLSYRIKSAARIACGEAPDTRDLEQRADYDVCVNKATNDAVESIHSPLVASAAGHSLPTEFLASR